MDQMQADLDNSGYAGKVALLSINDKNKTNQTAINSYCNGRTIPFLQDTAGENVYASWMVSKDDIVLVDKQGNMSETIDLAQSNLTQTANYDALMQKLKDLADAP